MKKNARCGSCPFDPSSEFKCIMSPPSAIYSQLRHGSRSSDGAANRLGRVASVWLWGVMQSASYSSPEPPLLPHVTMVLDVMTTGLLPRD